MRIMLLLAFTAAIIAGCATQPAPASWEEKLAARGYALGEPVERIRNYRINGWSELDRSHVVIEAGVRERYLLTLRQPCDGVSTAVALGFTTTAGGVTGFDRLIVRGPGSWFETCWINSIHRLERLPAAARSPDPLRLVADHG